MTCNLSFRAIDFGAVAVALERNSCPGCFGCMQPKCATKGHGKRPKYREFLRNECEESAFPDGWELKSKGYPD